jgi:3-dehydroquinate dehydratase
MQNPKEILARVSQNKKERKRVVRIIHEAFEQSKPWADADEALKEMKAKRAQIEASILTSYQSEQDQLDKLKASINDDLQLLADIALTLFMKGNGSTEIDLPDGTRYSMTVKASFKQLSLL